MVVVAAFTVVAGACGALDRGGGGLGRGRGGRARRRGRWSACRRAAVVGVARGRVPPTWWVPPWWWRAGTRRWPAWPGASSPTRSGPRPASTASTAAVATAASTQPRRGATAFGARRHRRRARRRPRPARSWPRCLGRLGLGLSVGPAKAARPRPARLGRPGDAASPTRLARVAAGVVRGQDPSWHPGGTRERSSGRGGGAGDRSRRHAAIARPRRSRRPSRAGDVGRPRWPAAGGRRAEAEPAMSRRRPPGPRPRPP